MCLHMYEQCVCVRESGGVYLHGCVCAHGGKCAWACCVHV